MLAIERLSRLNPQKPLSERRALGLFWQICRLPPDQLPEAEELFDGLSVPPRFAGDLAYTMARPDQRAFLWSNIFETRLPAKAELSAMAIDRLRQQSRIDLASTRPFFPDIPQPPNHLQFAPDGFYRGLMAHLFPHPVNGFPGKSWHQDTGPDWPRNLIRRESLDDALIRQLFPQIDDEQLQTELAYEFEAVVHSKAPQIEQKDLDLMRFLGLPDEETFIRKTEKELLDRVSAKGGNVERIQEFMAFSKETDRIRRKNRKTGESYYCHSLATAWFLWTMSEGDLKSEQDLEDLIEDVESAFIHDVPEDLESSIDPSSRKLNVSGIDQTLTLTLAQKLILEAVKKEDYDDGARWLARILNIKYPRTSDPVAHSRLLKRAAGLKIADRFSNFLTLTSTKDKYYDILRKLDETFFAFRRLVAPSSLSGLPAFARVNKLEALGRQTEEGKDLWGMSEAVSMEKALFRIQFGLTFLQHVYSLNKPWARHLKQIIDDKIAVWNGAKDTIPAFWQKRLDDLTALYQIDRSERGRIIPALELNRHFGLAHFVRQLSQEQAGEKPWGFNQFLPYFYQAGQFFRQYEVGRGTVLGGVDDLYFPLKMKYPGNILFRLGNHINQVLYQYTPPPRIKIRY